MNHQLPRLPDAVRTLSDYEADKLNRIHPGLPKSLRDCPTCQGDRLFNWYVDYPNDLDIVVYDCACADQIRLFKFFLNAGLGKSYQTLSWGDVSDELYASNVEAISAIGDYWQESKAYVSRGFGLMLHGSYGTGKTLLGALLLKRLLTHGRGLDGYFITFTTLLDRYTAGWDDKELASWFEKRVTFSEVLIIDDIGKEHAGRIKMSSNALDTLIRTRVQHDLPTIFTTNLSLDQFRDTYSGSTWSLLAEKVLSYEIRGEYKDKKVGYRDKKLQQTRYELKNRLIRPIVWS